MGIEDFDKNSDGTITANPIVGYQTALFGETACVLRLLYVSSEAQRLAVGAHGESKASSLQLAIHPQQALELSQALATMAQKALNPPSGGTQSS